MFQILYDANKRYKKIETIVLYFLIIKKSWNKLPKRARTWDYILKRVFFQNCIFEIVGRDFLKTNASILLKFCTLFLDKIDSWLNEEFFILFEYNIFYMPYMAELLPKIVLFCTQLC